ncbi:MAG: hypothetical protein M1829_001717 [Trizodia sp. TS-e1964]|nr:MAG: hypothetical protein M1829_001717 [Trizodia sp. TS-e1964]
MNFSLIASLLTCSLASVTFAMPLGDAGTGQPTSKALQHILPVPSTGDKIAILFHTKRPILEERDAPGIGLLLQVYASNGRDWKRVQQQYDEAIVTSKKWAVYHSNGNVEKIASYLPIGSIPVEQIKTYNTIVLRKDLLPPSTRDGLDRRNRFRGKGRWAFAAISALQGMIQPIPGNRLQELAVH